MVQPLLLDVGESGNQPIAITKLEGWKREPVLPERVGMYEQRSFLMSPTDLSDVELP